MDPGDQDERLNMLDQEVADAWGWVYGFHQ